MRMFIRVYIRILPPALSMLSNGGQETGLQENVHITVIILG